MAGLTSDFIQNLQRHRRHHASDPSATTAIMFPPPLPCQEACLAKSNSERASYRQKNHVKIKIMNFSSGSLLNWKSLAVRLPDYDSELEVISAILGNDGLVR